MSEWTITRTQNEGHRLVFEVKHREGHSRVLYLNAGALAALGQSGPDRWDGKTREEIQRHG